MSVRLLAVLLGVLVVAGCSSQNKPGAKDQARQHWNAARAQVLCRLAKQQYETGNLDDCGKSLDQAAAMDPKNPQIHILKGKLMIERGQLEAAESELRAAKALDEKNAEAEYLLGVVYQRWERPQAALEAYERACEKQPNELPYVLARAETLVAMDRSSDALAMLQERVVYFENSAAIRDAVGQLLVQQGRYAEAVPVLRQASILATDELQIREHLAMALVYAKQHREAMPVLEKLLKDEKYARRADVLTALGECQLLTGRYREARESFESAAQVDSGSVSIWLGLCKAALRLGDTPRANLSVRKAMSLEPNSSEVQLMLGYVRLSESKQGEALAAFRKASALDAKDHVSLCMIGYVLEKQGKHDEAMDYYARALKLKPNNELAATLMAQVQD